MERISISYSDVVNVCKAVNIDNDIEKMRLKYNTRITNTGTNISGGQRQRIILARALVGRPQLIILDEATSALDANNEKIIDNMLDRMSVIQIVVSHKFENVYNADCIIVLDDGKIVEKGTHEQLISNKGKYYDLYNKSVNYISED